jgi:UDP-GlcNAc:undecaprenyl-phosphate/decaprenyl-phosphate GlcNAc-1-phosphate transferase
VNSPLAQRVNYRGQTVFLGLGIVWVFWVAGMVVLRYAGEAAGMSLRVFVAIGAVSPLVITTLLFGVMDDAYGTAADRGFAGHISAIVHGRLTTGALKLLGIAFVSLAAAASIIGSAASNSASEAGDIPLAASELWPWAGWTVVLGGVIALSANLVNLTDLRPGRALKFYGVCAVALVIIAAASARASLPSAAMLAIALLGPLVAVWPLDAGERGMLGDAGANAAGALLGFVAAWECGRSWPAIVLLIVLFVINLASEKWSFSLLISHSRPLSWIDNVGRHPSSPAEKDSAGSAPQSRTSDG